ncbi:MAG: hypothetical protein QM698_02535 [Micropepsaceae bacterium]
MLSLLLIAAAVEGYPILPWSEGPLTPPCIMQEDPPGDIGGPPVKSGAVECTFELQDAAHGDGAITLHFEFRKSRYMPLDEDLDTTSKLLRLEETESGANSRPSLRLGGTFTSYSKPHFDDEAEIWLMPQWRDPAAQNAAVPGAGWQPVADAAHVRCDSAGARCRFIAREDGGLFAVIFFTPRRGEPIGVTAKAVKAVVANW